MQQCNHGFDTLHTDIGDYLILRVENLSWGLLVIIE